ncbi:unnamed protein product [Parnassius apollo]|uniref:(apollo) hypothetical protein n=1 Tax=Parnassius apollo TaxID=110799 RepID=A0A8S3WIP2_PARAO|nr:unnamed protein product [Parnassius apollo]
MKNSKLLIILLLVGTINADVVSEEYDEHEVITITKDFYRKNFIIYNAKHDVVNILVPTNSLNFDENDDEEKKENFDKYLILFFVEADVDTAGNIVDKGLYVYKNGQATKLLENGRDAAASSDNSTDVFFGAKDGIYMYDNKENKAVKYGSVTDDIIAIAKENATDVIYYLNKDHELYKVTDNGKKSVKINDVVGAQEIVLDRANNLYFYTEDKQVYVLNENGVKKFTELPEHPKSVKLIKPPVLEEGVVLLTFNAFYVLYPNGKCKLAQFVITSNAKPSAYAMEGTVVQYFAYHKKIYKYNLLEILAGDVFEDLNKLLEENQGIILNASPVNKISTCKIKKYKQI